MNQQDEAELKPLRAQIKAVLDEVVAAEKKEAAEIDAQLAQKSTLGKTKMHADAFGKGLWAGAVGLIQFVGTVGKVALYLNPIERANNLLTAAYHSYQAGDLSKAGWRDSLTSKYNDEECKDLANLFGIDPRTVTSAQLQQLKLKLVEAYELASFIWDDAPSKELFTEFGKEYTKAQSSVEMTQVGGGLVFEVVLNVLLAATTLGAGNAANAAGQMRHVSILSNLEAPLANMGKALKRIRLKKAVPSPANVPTRVVADLPPGVPLQAKAPPAAKKVEKPAPTKKATDEPGKNKSNEPAACNAKTPKDGCPISLVTGEEILERTDFAIAGAIPLSWIRQYKSSNPHDTGLGHGWTHTFAEKLTITGNTLEYHTHEARVIPFPMPDIGGTSINRTEKWCVERMGDDYFLVTPVNNPAALVREFSRPLADGSLPLQSLSDAMGNRMACHYEQARLQKVVAPHGAQWLFDYNGRGQIIAVKAVAIDGNSKTLATYTYDAANDLISAADAGGHAEKYAYDNHLIKRRTLKSGYNFHFQWDGHTSNARCVRNWGDAIDGQPTYDYRFAWDKPHRKVSVTDTRGGIKHYHYNNKGLPIYFRDQEGGEFLSAYDAHGNLTAETDPLGQTRQFVYDEADRLLSAAEADGAETRFGYDEHGNLAQVVDPAGQCWKRESNLLGQLIKHSNPLGENVRYEYNANGQISAIINPLNAAWRYLWNDRAQLIAIRNPQALHTRYQYDEEGNLIAMIGPDRQRTEYAYDANGHCTLIKTADGRSQQFEYNELGLLTQQRDASGRVTQYHYNGLSQVVKRVDPLGHALQYHYDGERNLIGLTNENGERYTLKYDLNERLIEEIGFDGRVQRYQYNVAGQLTASTAYQVDGKTPQSQMRYVRNGNGQLLEQWSDPTPAHPKPQCLGKFSYDKHGRMIGAENNDRQLQWVFDAAGRVLEDHQDDAVLKHTYDRLGRRIATELPNGSQLRYDFDAGTALNALWFDNVELARVNRDDYGRETERVLGPQLKTETSYDPQGRLQKQRILKHTAGHHPHAPQVPQTMRGTVLQTRGYHYNDQGQLSRIDDARRGSTQYHYDTIDRLIRVEGPNPETFVHDPAGNVLADKPSAIGQGNRLAFHGDSHYQYDAQGNRSAQQRGKDRKLATTYTYDAQNQLTAITANGIETRYAYDPLGRRIQKENPTSRTEFLWLDDVLLSETTCAEKHNDNQTTTRTYVFEPYSFKPLAFIENQKLYYYHLDHLGTPQEVSDHQGNIVWSGNYRAYGSLAVAQENAVENHLRFQGQYFDDESGLHYNRFRYYDPQVGRFINQDPIGLLGGINNYQYVPNPVGWVDPFGLSCKEGYLAEALEGHKPDQGFSGVYDEGTGKILIKPSPKSATAPVPDGWVPRRGGHAYVSQELGGDRALHHGFAATLESDGSLSTTWLSRTLNKAPGNLVPESIRPKIVDELGGATGRAVSIW